MQSYKVIIISIWIIINNLKIIKIFKICVIWFLNDLCFFLIFEVILNYF